MVPEFESLLRISFFLRIRPRDIYINIVIMLIETTATVEQLVKVCVSFAEHQGSISVSLKFFFSKLKSTNTWSCRIVVWRCSLVLETKVQTPYPLIFPIFYHYFFGEWLFGFLSSIYSLNHILVFLSSHNPCARPFFFLYFCFLTLWCLFYFSFCIFVFSPCAMTIILDLLIATDLLKRHRFWARSWRNQ